MLDLFIRKRLFDLNGSALRNDPVQIKYALFSQSPHAPIYYTNPSHSKPSSSQHVSHHQDKQSPKNPQNPSKNPPESSQESERSVASFNYKKVLYRLLLACDSASLLLVLVRDPAFTQLEHLWIPIDPAKGQVVGFAFNHSGDECILLTEQTFVYRIPLNFHSYYDEENQVERKIVMTDAQVIHSCSLSKPSSIVWWDRSKYSTVHASIAIIGNRFGQICLLDLDTEKVIRQLTVPFAIESMIIYEEIFSRTLLINCAKNFQYAVMLEQLRSAAGRKKGPLGPGGLGSPSGPGSGSASSMGSAFQYGYYLVNSLSGGSDEVKSILQGNIKPQPISIKEEEKKLSDSDSKTFEEFINIFENDLLVSLWPQETSRFLYIVKQCKPHFEFESEISSSPKSVSSTEFCGIANKMERNFDIYEFNSQEFCSEKVFLNSATKYFYVGLNAKAFNDSDSVCDSRFLKIINCGERFLVLVFTKFVVIVSKHFAEQKSLSSHSPRSPLVLKKSDSFRNSGSFRRRNYSAHNVVSKSNSLPLTSVVDTFTPNDSCPIFDSNDEIVNVFFVSKPSNSMTMNCSVCSKNEEIYAENEVQRIFNIEVSSVEHKLHDDIKSLFKMNEQFVIVTKNGICTYITCQEEAFGDYFHNRMCELLNTTLGGNSPNKNKRNERESSNTCLDGDIITNAKYIVDCFVARSNLSNTSKFYCRLNQTNISPQNRLTTWQFWITRSGLLLLKELSQTEFSHAEFRKVLRLFELARTPRRRVITSLIYFKFWDQALVFLRKYFETNILQELNGEERLFLSHQMFDCLLKNLEKPPEDSEENPGRSRKDSNGRPLEELLKFLKDYFTHYDIEIVFDTLLEKKLFNIAKYVARVNYSYVHLFEILLKNLRLGKSNVDEQELFEFFTQPDIGYYLLLSACYPTNTILGDRIFSLQTFEQYLDFVLQNLSRLTIEQLARVERVFNPTKLHMQMLIEKILACSQDGWVLQSGNNKSIEKRDIVNLYLFILLITFKRRISLTVPDKNVEDFSFYDWNFLSDIRNDFRAFSVRNSIPLSDAKSRVFLACGAYFSLLAINDENVNRIFLWGQFPYYHPCDSEGSRGSTSGNKRPIMLKFFTHLMPPGSIHQIACGAQHILFLTDFGVLSLGSSTYGQLGLGASHRRTRLPAPIRMFSSSNTGETYVKVVKVACGSYHSLAVSETGDVWAWGWALHGQLGYGGIEDAFLPIKVMKEGGAKAIDVAAGYAHSVVLCDNGDLYVFGDNSFNQLGLEPERKITKSVIPRKMTSIRFGSSTSIRLISCGLYHTVVLAVYSERKNASIEDKQAEESVQEANHERQEGEEDDKEKTTDAKLDEEPEQEIEQRLYSWGLDPKTWRIKMRTERRNDASLRTNFALKDFTQPNEISLEGLSPINVDPGSRIIKLVSGQAHNVLLTRDGRVLTFGYGREGQLGLGPDTSNARISARILPELFQVQDIAAGVVHSLAVNNDSLWGWGQNAEMNSFPVSSVEDSADSEKNTQNSSGNTSANTSGTTPNHVSTTISSSSKTTRSQQEEFWSSKLASYQKCNESIPYRIISFDKLIQNTVKTSPVYGNGLKTQFYYPDDENVGLLTKLKICLARFGHLLDLQQSIARFKTFNLTQLASVLSFAKGDFCQSYQLQLHVWKEELMFRFRKTEEKMKKMHKKEAKVQNECKNNGEEECNEGKNKQEEKMNEKIDLNEDLNNGTENEDFKGEKDDNDAKNEENEQKIAKKSTNEMNYERFFVELKALSHFYLEIVADGQHGESETIHSHLNALIECWNDVESIFSRHSPQYSLKRLITELYLTGHPPQHSPANSAPSSRKDTPPNSPQSSNPQSPLKPGAMAPDDVSSEPSVQEPSHSLTNFKASESLDKSPDSISSPFFGLNLLKLVHHSDEIRHRHDFDDQFLFNVLTRTSSLTGEHPNQIVQFQVFMQQFMSTSTSSSSSRETNARPNSSSSSASSAAAPTSLLTGGESGQANLNFPLEFVFRKNVAMLTKHNETN